MTMRNEPLIPVVGVITDIRIDTPDIKTFRVLTPERYLSCILFSNA